MARGSVTISQDKFLEAFMKAQSEGKCYQDLGKQLDLEPTTCYQKWLKVNKILSASGVTLPSMPMNPSRKGSVSVESLLEIVSRFSKVNTPVGTAVGKDDEKWEDVE